VGQIWVQKQIKFFWFYVWGQTQGVQIIEEASQWGVRWQRRCRGTHYAGPSPGMGEEDIMYCGVALCSTNIRENAKRMRISHH
jgi:hypothetical protein